MLIMFENNGKFNEYEKQWYLSKCIVEKCK